MASTTRSIEERNQLAADNLGLAGAVVKKFWSNGVVRWLGFDDCFSECCLILMAAANSWDENRGVKFSSYAMTAMGNRMVELIRAGNRRSMLQLEEANPEWMEQSAAPDRRSDVLELLWRLPERPRLVIRLLLDGKTTDQISEVLGMPVCHGSQKMVGALKSQGIRTLRKLLAD